MASEISLTETLMGTISEYLRDSGAMLTGFVAVASYLGEDGHQAVRICAPASQGSAMSLGLIAFGDECVREDLRAAMFVDEDGE